MNKNFNYSDLINDYFDGTLSKEQEQGFHALLQTDPLFKNEFEFQKDVVQEIRKFRKSELKNRLERIKIPASPFSNYISYRTVSGILAVSLISLGSYFLVTNRPASENIFQELINLEQVVVFDQQLPIPDPKINKLASRTQEKIILNEGTSKNIQKDSKPLKTEKDVLLIKPNIISDFEDEEISSPLEKTVSSAVTSSNNQNIHSIEIENKVDINYQFHYQFFDHKLFLYGDFDDSPYEILELFTKSDKKIYLFHKGAFYYIRKNKERVTPMEPVTNKKLIKELHIIKNNNN